MRDVKVALAAGLALVIIAIGLTLGRSPMSVLASNRPPGLEEQEIASTNRSASYCQAGEELPRGTSAMRIWLGASAGPRVTVSVSSAGHPITSGVRGSNWIGGSVTIPVKPTARTVSGVTVCVSFRLHDETLIVQGNNTPPAVAARDGARALSGRMWIEYLHPGSRSWASLALTVARHLGLGRAAAGTWVSLAVLVLMLAIAVLAGRLVVGDLSSNTRTARTTQGRGQALWDQAARLPGFRGIKALRRIPRAAWICALVACLNAVCWSIVTPPFQVPDEPDHFAYVKQLAETGTMPSSNGEPTGEELTALAAVHHNNVRLQPQNHTIASQSEQQALERALAMSTHQTGSPAAGVARSQPPLYYALEAIPYTIAESGTVLDRLQLMRLISALFAGLTAMFVYLFVRETLPAAPWTWTVGGLSVALAPLLGFMSGAVNPDAMLFAVSAAVFYALARAFRRGLSTHGAAAIGALTAIGILTKVNFIGLVPGVILAAIVLSVRAKRVSGSPLFRPLAISVMVAFSPILLYAAVNTLSNQPTLGVVTRALGSSHGSMLAQINYIWQLYLPRIPGTVNDFPGLFTTRQLWFDGYVGLYGWLDTPFPAWVCNLALIPTAAIALLCGRSLLQRRATLRGRISEIAVYVLMSVGLVVLIGAASYRSFPETDAEYAQARYLLPLLALLGAVLALAARGAGRRWGPVVGVLIVVLFLAHDIFSQLQVAARYYG